MGVSDLPVQRLKRSPRKPFGFNIMVVGESGLGKTTFMNTLFNAPLTEKWEADRLTETGKRTVAIQPRMFELEEEGVVLHLTVVDTPGFGDQLNRETK